MQRRFRFQLETVLRVRELHEREAARKLGAMQAELARTESLLRQTQDELSLRQMDLLAAQSMTAIDALSVTRQRGWIAHLRRALVERQGIRSRLNAELAQLRAAWVAARTQTRILLKLKERRQEAHRRAVDRVDQAESDELARNLLMLREAEDSAHEEHAA